MQRRRLGSGATQLDVAVLRRRCSSTSPEAAAVLIPVNSSEGLPTLTAGQQEVKSAMMADARPFKLLFAGPGYGKTVVMMSIIIDFYNRGFWVRCLVPLSQVCGDIRRKLEASGMPALAAAETVMTVQRFTTPGFVDSSMQPGGNIERAVRRLVMFDEALSLDGDLLDNVYYKMGGDVRLAQFMMFGDCFQMPSVGIPAAHSVMLQPTAEFRLFSFPSGGSMRTSTDHYRDCHIVAVRARQALNRRPAADRVAFCWDQVGGGCLGGFDAPSSREPEPCAAERGHCADLYSDHGTADGPRPGGAGCASCSAVDWVRRDDHLQLYGCCQQRRGSGCRPDQQPHDGAGAWVVSWI